MAAAASRPKKKAAAKGEVAAPGASPKRSARRGASGSGLTAARIRDEALKLIDAEGLDSFSTRRLGAALGCEAMAIYWYYPSKEVLLDAVVEALITRLPLDPAPDGDWIEALRKLARGYRALAHQHPHAFPLLAMRRFATEPTWRFLEGVFELAAQGGLDSETTARYFRLVASYCSGAALDELAGLREAERAKAAPGEALQQAAAAAEAFPNLSSVASYLEPAHYDDVFEFGLELLLGSLAQAATRGAGLAKPRPKRA
ncbi:MAG: Transcriptional regulator, TetR family [Labilithrix sp.]|nr:Transcriptional regulator, TetR family [Labilithrix sp.]